MHEKVGMGHLSAMITQTLDAISKVEVSSTAQGEDLDEIHFNELVATAATYDIDGIMSARSAEVKAVLAGAVASRDPAAVGLIGFVNDLMTNVLNGNTQQVGSCVSHIQKADAPQVHTSSCAARCRSRSAAGPATPGHRHPPLLWP